MEVSNRQYDVNSKCCFKTKKKNAKGPTRSIYRRAEMLHDCPEETTDTHIHCVGLTDTFVESSSSHIVTTTRDTSSSNQKMQDDVGSKKTKKKRHSCICKGLKYALLSCYKSGIKCSMKSVSEPDDDECYMPVSVEKKILPECNTHESPKDHSHSQIPLFSVSSRSTTQDESNQWNNSNIDATKGKELVAVTNNRRCHEMVDSIPLHTWMTYQGSPSVIPGVFRQTSVEKCYPLKLSETYFPPFNSMIQVYKVSSQPTADIPKSSPPGTVFSFRPRRQTVRSSHRRKKRTSVSSDESSGSADLINARKLRIKKVEYEDKKGRKKKAYVLLPRRIISNETSSETTSNSDSTTPRAPVFILRGRSPAGSEGVGVTLRDARRSVLVPHEDGAVPFPFIPECDMPPPPFALMAKGGDDEDEEEGEDDEDYEDDEGGEDDEDYEDEGGEDDEDYEDDEGGEDDDYDDEDVDEDDYGDDGEDFDEDDDEYDDEDPGEEPDDSEKPSCEKKGSSEKNDCVPCQIVKAMQVFSTLFKPPCPNNPSCPGFSGNFGARPPPYYAPGFSASCSCFM